MRGNRHNWGLSPRVRGNPAAPYHCRYQPCRGLSPRVRGNLTAYRGQWLAGRWVYPRVCGGTPSMGAVYPRVLHRRGLSPRVDTAHPAMGLSPRVRGNLSPPLSDGPSLWSSSEWVPVYPRVCGGTSLGSSPRVPTMQGCLARPRRRCHESGSIPACAGEPIWPATVVKHLRGLSPRVRGNPHAAGGSANTERVYPRVCGGTRSRASSGGLGLSPRVRGNPVSRRIGSIPACAGEPWLVVKPVRVRGNSMSGPDRGSIPACAGEPPIAMAWSSAR